MDRDRLFEKILSNFKTSVKLRVDEDIEREYKRILSRGKDVLPREMHKLSMINCALNSKSVIFNIANLKNRKFNDLPLSVRPMYERNGTMYVCGYMKQGKIMNEVYSLLNFDNVEGFWCDNKGNRVNLWRRDER